MANISKEEREAREAAATEARLAEEAEAAKKNFAVTNESNSTATVTVACKLPHGLILRVFRKVERQMPVMGGGFRTESVHEPLEQTYTVYGWSHPQNAAPHCTIVGGYAMTPGIPKEHWDLWMSQNKHSDMVKNQMIFAYDSMAKATGESKDRAGVKSNIERLDPNNLPSKQLKTSDLMKREA